jgi:hypothetical protein
MGTSRSSWWVKKNFGLVVLAPARHQLLQELQQRGRFQPGRPGLAGRQQHAETMALQRSSCSLHFCRSAIMSASSRTRHMLPVAQDHGHGGHGRAQFMGRAGGQQAQAHDVLFLAGALAHVGQAAVARRVFSTMRVRKTIRMLVSAKLMSTPRV